MLITCGGCNKKMRVPDSAAGKRIKCPKCATVMRVPETPPPDGDSPAPDSEAAAISSRPLPSPPPVEPAAAEADETDGTEVTASTPSSSPAKPPPLKATRTRGSFDDDDDDDEPAPPSRRRDRDDDDDDDDIDDIRRNRAQPVNSLATTSMTMGILAISLAALGICCCPIALEPIAVVCGVLAIIFGFMGKTPGSEGTAMTGIICGSVSLVIVVIAIFLVIFWVGINMMGVMNQPPRRFN
jgi:hypothetical protein